MGERSYMSLKNESARMFKSDLVERFSRVQLSILSIAELFVLGLMIWTLLEYIIHRFAFHYEPKTRIGKQFHFIVHGVHHDYPNDAKRLVMPPAVSIPVAVVFYALFLFLFGRAAPAIWAGFIAGYVCYDSIHYAI